LCETASYELSCVKISSVVFPVEDSKKKKEREGKERKGKAQKVTQALYFTYSWASPRKWIFHMDLGFLIRLLPAWCTPKLLLAFLLLTTACMHQVIMQTQNLFYLRHS